MDGRTDENRIWRKLLAAGPGDDNINKQQTTNNKQQTTTTTTTTQSKQRYILLLYCFGSQHSRSSRDYRIYGVYTT
jgi:hypothetical protein